MKTDEAYRFKNVTSKVSCSKYKTFVQWPRCKTAISNIFFITFYMTVLQQLYINIFTIVLTFQSNLLSHICLKDSKERNMHSYTLCPGSGLLVMKEVHYGLCCFLFCHLKANGTKWLCFPLREIKR